MDKIILKNEPIFSYSDITKNLVEYGEISGEYILCKNIKSKNLNAVICCDTKEIHLILIKK